MTPDQAMLLRAVLLSGEAGERNANEWCSTADLDSVDGSSHKLLPLLFRSLSSRELAPRNMDRLRGVYRKSWYRNQQHVAAVSKAIEALDTAGIDHAVVAGLPIALTAYGDLGARSLYVARLVVPAADVERAVGRVARRGFEIQRSARVYGWGVPTILGTSTGGVLDIRGSVYGPGWADGRGEDLRERQVELVTETLASSTLDATDTIVLAAVEAASTPESWLQGLVDVALLARAADAAVDWSEVARRYGDSAMSVPLHDALSALVDDLGVAVGADAGRWHAEHRSRLRDRVAFWPHRNGRRLLRLVPWYLRGRRSRGQDVTPSGFVSFAAAVYGIDSRTDFVKRVKRRAMSWRATGR